MLTVEQARALMHQWVASPSLRAHMEAVAACMGAYAERFEPNQRDRWFIAGLLHDMDYERHPTPAEHPRMGVEHLRTLGVDQEILEAILGHADYTGTPRRTPMARCLYAVDELAGFIIACAKVRPNGIADLEPASVRRKLKDKAFAAGVHRQDIARSLAELAPLLDAETAQAEEVHLRTCIAAIRAHARACGL